MKGKLEFDLPPYYKLIIDYNNGISIISNSKHSKGKALKLQKSTDGYLRIRFGSTKQTYSLHYLVAKNCLGERPEGYTINHIDGNKLNNYPENLDYLTIEDNIKHAMENGLHVSHNPKNHGKYKDGRCKDKNAYKLAWYYQNRDKVLTRMKEKYERGKTKV